MLTITGEDDDERDYDGKRPGGPMNGLASKKRRKQSKPIRLGNDSIGGERSNNVAEDGGEPNSGEKSRYFHVSELEKGSEERALLTEEKPRLSWVSEVELSRCIGE